MSSESIMHGVYVKQESFYWTASTYIVIFGREKWEINEKERKKSEWNDRKENLIGTMHD